MHGDDVTGKKLNFADYKKIDITKIVPKNIML